MSRIAKSPIELTKGVEISQADRLVKVKGPKGELTLNLHESVALSVEDNVAKVTPVNEEKTSWAQAGTARSLIANMVAGVSQGFEKKLELVGVGYRAQVKGNLLNLSVGYSHPVEYELPNEVSAEMPSQTEIILKSADKQALGQVAANIRAYRPPEPYKGKGIRYSDEYVRRKEAKKK
jgi:large subunit ribosomal protein L6